jgi:hypothetical protein
MRARSSPGADVGQSRRRCGPSQRRGCACHRHGRPSSRTSAPLACAYKRHSGALVGARDRGPDGRAFRSRDRQRCGRAGAHGACERCVTRVGERAIRALLKGPQCKQDVAPVCASLCARARAYSQALVCVRARTRVYVRACVYLCVCMCVWCVRACACVFACVCVRVRIYVCDFCICAYGWLGGCVCARTYVPAYMLSVHVSACVCACMHACVCACVCTHACVRTFAYACVRARACARVCVHNSGLTHAASAERRSRLQARPSPSTPPLPHRLAAAG